MNNFYRELVDALKVSILLAIFVVLVDIAKALHH
jgi:hypothetical protein